MSKTKATKVDSKKASKKVDAPQKVKEGRVTKPSQTPKAKSKEIAKSAASGVEKKKKKSKKAPTPEPESESEESTSSASEDDSDSSSSEEEKPATKKTNGAAKPAVAAKAEESSSDSESDSSASDSSESDSSDSDVEMEDAPKAATPKTNGAVKPAAKKESDSSDSSESEGDSDSSDSESESEEEAKPAAKTAKAEADSDNSSDDSSSDSDADSDSNESSDSDEEEAPSKKRKAEAEAEPVVKKTKTEAAGEEGVKNLFVGNLSWNVDEDWLSSTFAPYGTIEGCRIITDRESGRSKGFGYVEFTTAEAAKAAKDALHDSDLDGRPLNVDFSQPRQQNQDKGAARAKQFGDKRSPPSNTLFIGNLSFDSTNESIGEAFGQFGEVARVSLPTDRETGAPKGFGYVEFGSVQEAQAALDGLSGQEVDGRNIRIDFASARDNNGGGDRGGRGGGRGGFGGRGGGRGGRGGFGDRGRGGRGGARGGRGGFSTNRGGFNDFKGSKVTF